MLETIPKWQVYFCRARSFSPARASWSRSPASRWRTTCAVGRGQPTAIPNRLGNQETWGARPILKKLGSCNNTPPLILMVYRTHLWWFWGWFIIALPTLLYFCGLRNAGVSRGFSMLFLASWLGSAFHLWLVPSACSLLEMRLSNLLAMIVRPKRAGSDRFFSPCFSHFLPSNSWEIFRLRDSVQVTCLSPGHIGFILSTTKLDLTKTQLRRCPGVLFCAG